MERHYDFAIIGAGIIGLSFALKLSKDYPSSKILLLEKEKAVGEHASGRNSGVLHSGIYYKEGTLKAKLCARGAKEMKAFCQEHHLICKRIGKVIVPTEESLDPHVDTLFNRGKSNGVGVEIIDERALKSLEPEVKSASERALLLPDTCVVNPKEILVKIQEVLKQRNVDLITNAQVKTVSLETNALMTTQGKVNFGFLINAAGTNADKLATLTGLDHPYTMIPFRGVYFKVKGDIAKRIHRLVYPVPNLDMPFLGVHTTTTPDGSVYLGPTAMPSFGRENYHGLSNISFNDTKSNFSQLATMYLNNTQGLRKHVHYEMMTLLFKRHLLGRAKKLIPNLTVKNIENCPKRGIRPQLFNKDTKQLEMDFVVKKHKNSIHILNAISPAFTSSLAFVGHVLEQMEVAEPVVEVV